jgi:hypothetical protein
MRRRNWPARGLYIRAVKSAADMVKYVFLKSAQEYCFFRKSALFFKP